MLFHGAGAVGRVRSRPIRGGSSGPALPSDATLDLDFTVPGTMPAGVTFTRASATATYFDATGVMRTAATNVPRWGYDPATLMLRGLLLEEARTNVVMNSTMVGAVAGTPGTDPTGWSLVTSITGLTKSVIGTGTEAGIAYTDYRFSGTVSAGNLNLVFTPVGTGGGVIAPSTFYAASLFMSLKGGNFTNISSMSIRMNTYTSAGGIISAVATQNISLLGLVLNDPLTKNRLSGPMTTTTPATAAFTQPYILFVTLAGPIDFTIRIGAPQFEAGRIPTSFIPTSNAAVTRAADSCSMPTGAWFNPNSSTLFGEFMYPRAASDSASAHDIASLNAGATNTNRMVIRAMDGGVAQTKFYSNTLGTVVNGNLVGTPIADVSKVAAAFEGITGRGAFNGNGVTYTVMPALPDSINTLTIGNNHSTTGDAPLDAYVRRVRYFPLALSDAQLILMTQADRVPSFDVSFMTPGVLNPQLVFSRGAGPATYFDSAGTMQTAAANAPRWEYDPNTLALQGLLIEDSRTNVIMNSTMVGAVAGSPGTAPTGWSLNTAGLTRTIVGVGTEKGIPYIEVRFAGTAAGGNAFWIFTPAGAASAIISPSSYYAWSIYMSLRAGTLTNITSMNFAMNTYLAGGANAGSAVSPVFDLTQLHLGDALTKTRFSGTHANPTNAAAVNAQPYITVVVAAGPVDFTLRIGAPQFEIGCTTSFIPTSTVGVSRSSDELLAPVGPWFNAAASTLYGEFIYPRAAADKISAHSVVGMSTEVVGGDRMALRATEGFTTTARFYANVGGVGAGSNIAGNAMLTASKMAASFDGVTGMGALNGGPVATAAVGMPVGMLSMAFGNDAAKGAGGAYLDGYLRRVAYWPVALTSGELQAVTT